MEKNRLFNFKNAEQRLMACHYLLVVIVINLQCTLVILILSKSRRIQKNLLRTPVMNFLKMIKFGHRWYQKLTFDGGHTLKTLTLFLITTWSCWIGCDPDWESDLGLSRFVSLQLHFKMVVLAKNFAPNLKFKKILFC